MIKHLFSKLAILLLPVLVLGGVVSASAADFGGNPSVNLSNQTAGNSALYNINFRTSNVGALVSGEEVNITFPAGTDLSSSSLVGYSGFSGSVSYSYTGTNAKLTLDPGTTIGNNIPVSLAIDGVINPSIASNLYTLVITSNSGATLIDGPNVTNLYTIQPRAPNQDQSSIDTNPSGITTMTVGTNLGIVFTARDEYGNVIPAQDVAWSVSNSNFSLDRTTGITNVTGTDTITLTAPTNAGESTTVTAQSGSIVHTITLTTATIATTPDALDHIVITPDTDQNITAGGTVTFTATGYDVYGNEITGLTFDWTNATNGVFSNTTAGTYAVTANVGETISNTVYVTVDHNVTTTVVISPNTTQDIVAGTDINFTATAYDAYGNATGDTVTWTGTSNTDSGLFNNRTMGSYTVYATAGGIESTRVTVNVDHNITTNVVISPNTTQNIIAGANINFTATAYDAYGNATGDTVTWTGTSNTNSGLFNNRTMGSYTVYATAGGIQSTHVTVNVDHSFADLIGIYPLGPVNITADDTQAFGVNAYDIYNNSWDVTNQAAFYIMDIWGNYNPSMGYFTGNVYNAVGVGNYLVYAYYGASIPWTTTVDVNVSHGQINNIVINPVGPINMTADQTQTFSVTAYDSDGNSWDVTNTSSYFENDPVGYFTDNTYNAGHIGTWTIYATNNGHASNNVLVNVDHGEIVQFIINPQGDIFLTSDQSNPFMAIGFDADANMWDITNDVTWNENDPWGFFTGNTYYAGMVGTWTVDATYNSLTSVNNATMHVSHGVVTLIAINPTNTTITADDTQTYTVTATDADGNTWDVTADATFAIQTGANGSWTDNVYDAQTAGTWVVTASYAGVTDATTNLTVTHGVAVSIDVTPNSSLVIAGENETYFVTATDADGNTWDVTADATFAIQTGANGSWTDNVYTAHTAGTWVVTANYQGLSNTATLTVNPAVLDYILITPNTDQNIIAGNTLQFNAVGYDVYGNVRTGDVFTWTNTNASGLFTNTTAGTYAVQAHSGTIDSNIVNITVDPASLDHIVITPNTDQNITAGGTITFTATGYDIYGNEITGLTFDWTNATNGVFSNTTAGTYAVTANIGGTISNTVYVTVDHNVTTSVVITPNTTQDIVAGQTIQFSATAYDAYGNATGDVIIWTGTDVNGLFNQTTMGTYTVYATANGVESTHVTVNVDHNVTTLVTISPNTDQTVVAGQNFTFSALAYDIYNNPTGDTITWTEANNGVFNKTSAGDYIVWATANGVDSDYVIVHVIPAGLDHIVITPSSNQTITAGQDLQFDAIGYDQYNNPRTGDLFNWAVTSGSTTTWYNNLSSYLFNYRTALIYNIHATANGVDSNYVTVTVNHAQVDNIVISPNNIDNATSGTFYFFNTTAYDIFGNSWNVTTQATYSLDSDDAFGVFNTLTSSARYTAGQIGTRHIYVNYLGKTAVAVVNITNHSATVSSIQITNNIANVMVGNTHGYQVRFRDAYGNSWDGTNQVAWSISPNGYATIDANGILTGTFIGSNITVTATYLTKTDSDTFDVIANPEIGGFMNDFGSDNTTFKNTSGDGIVAGENTEEGKVSSISTENNNSGKNTYLTFILILIALALLFLGYNLANDKDDKKRPKKMVKTA